MRKAKKVIIGGLIGAGIGGGIAASDEVVDYSKIEQERFEEVVAEQELTQQRLDEIEIRLGESCVAAMKPYLGGGELEGTEEDSVVQDVVLNGNEPCGENPTDIRQAYRQLDEANSSNEWQQYSLDVRQEQLSDAIAGEEDGFDWKKTLVFAVMPGIVIGGVTAVVSQPDEREYLYGDGI